MSLTKRSTFTDFQAIPLEVLELASLKVLGMDFNTLFDKVFTNYQAANDNDNAVDKAISVFLDKDLMEMLRCWVACNKDMLLAKLTYEQGVNYGTES